MGPDRGQNRADRQAHREANGAAYLRGVDAVHSALTRAVVLRQSLDAEGLAKTLAELRSSFGAALDTEALSQEAEALIRARDRTPTKVEARRALRRLGQQIANRSAIVLDPELASYYLGDIFALRLADLREQFTELRRMSGGTAHEAESDSKRIDGALLSGRIENLLQSIEYSIATAIGPQGNPAIKETLEKTFQPFGLMMSHALAMMESGSGDPAAIQATFDAIDRFALAANGQFVELVTPAPPNCAKNGCVSAPSAERCPCWPCIRRGPCPARRHPAVAPHDGSAGPAGRWRHHGGGPRIPVRRRDRGAGRAMRRFKQALEDSRSLSHTVVQSTMQVSVATGQAAAAIAQVSDGAHGQMASVERLRRSFLETREAMKEVAAVTRTGQERSRDAADRLEESLSDIDAMSTAVREIADMSSEINRVTVAIGKLAAHSNILSLNASIEASRAGEHGRGFSVVAGAVGTLAQQTLGLAQEIAGLASRSNDRIARGLEVASAVGQRMQEVSITIAETDSLSQTIVDQVARRARERRWHRSGADRTVRDLPRQRLRRRGDHRHHAQPRRLDR